MSPAEWWSVGHLFAETRFVLLAAAAIDSKMLVLLIRPGSPRKPA
jgi:hypothetical protein